MNPLQAAEGPGHGLCADLRLKLLGGGLPGLDVVLEAARALPDHLQVPPTRPAAGGGTS